MNISLFHGAYEARKCKKSSKNHIFRKKFGFFFLNFIFTIHFLDVSDHFKSFGTHFWRHFLKKFHCKFLLDLAMSKVTLVHVHAFLSLKLNAIIIFEIHITFLVKKNLCEKNFASKNFLKNRKFDLGL